MCSHPRRQFYRVVIADGRTQVTERCLDCGANPRAAAWVPRSEVPVPIDRLPLLSEGPRRPPQPGLFD